MKHNRQPSAVVLIAQIMAELKLFQLIQLIHFDDCIQCDLIRKELIRYGADMERSSKL